MIERQYLSGSIYLRNQKNGQESLFTVRKMIGEGAACVSYEAKREGKLGVLKEFWPQEEYDDRASCALDERSEQGQLLLNAEYEDINNRFREVQKEFEDCHIQLQKALEESNQDEKLSRYIPSFAIYRGHSTAWEGDGTTYLWFEEATARADTTFEAFCRKIHDAPYERPEYKLAVALHAVLSLTQCIRLLHKAELLHRDIKPENFGFLELGDNMLTQFPRIFDLDTICPARNPPNKAIKTLGYTEPEVDVVWSEYFPHAQTDIYAIGATLFHAVIVTDETKKTGYRYDPKVHGGRLKELIDGSQLIQATERNRHPRLRAFLKNILTRCLSRRAARYKNCEELEEDLNKAFFYTMPSEVVQEYHLREKWVLADAEKSLDANRNKNSTLAIQYHLYEYPIYLHCAEEDPSINILTVGFGNYGQKFLDACLQAGQSCGKQLHITVLSENTPIDPDMETKKQETDVDLYLKERPALAEFFRIVREDGSQPAEVSEPYGEITFRQNKLNLDNKETYLEDVLCEQHFHYVFIAMGNDNLNRDTAEVYQNAAAVLEHPPLHISYACEGNVAAGSAVMYPVCVNKQMEETDLHQEIERMAFNVHRIWETDWNRDIKAVREKFQEKYNHDACVAHILALKYTLGRLGIPMEQDGDPDFDGAARSFVEKLSNAANRSTLKNELICAEHRRWVTEKLCLGWQKRKVEDCIDCSTKDEQKREHVCIVRSRPDQMLTHQTNHRVEKWDEISETDLKKYDELDQVSVDLHRFYRERAAYARDLGLLSENQSLSGLRTRVVQDCQASSAFQEWFICAKDIQNGDREKAPLYDGLREAFLLTTERLDPDTKKYVRDTVEQFDRDFQPVVASMRYQDLKQEDVKLIDSIPFILTYAEDAYLVIPYGATDFDNPFGNVAAATVVNPKTVLYLVQINSEEDICQLERSFAQTAGYMSKKCPQTRMEIIAICGENMAKRVAQGIRRQSWKKHCEQVEEVMSVENLDALHRELLGRQAGKRVFAVEKNGICLSTEMEQQGIYDTLPCYRFHAETLQFEGLNQCDALGYIRKVPYITAADLCVFGRTLIRNSDRPEFSADYELLWKKYSNAPSTWKKLCGALKDEPSERRTPSLVCLARLREEWMTSPKKAKKYRYIIPFTCARAAQNIVEWLKDKGVLEEESFVAGYTTASCEVVLFNRFGDVFKHEYDKLFSDFYALMSPDNIKTLSLDGMYVIEFDSLAVSNALLPGDDGNRCENLLRYFNEYGYILNLQIRDGTVRTASFTYGSRQIKALLTVEGKLLEIYTYHKMKDLRRFDDVVTGFEVNWGDSEEHNEFDCIATKGFRTLIVECKARSKLETEFYDKLHRLTERLGTNATAVLVADTREKREDPENAERRAYGKEMGIITIWKQDELNDIGHVLFRVMQGTYEQGGHWNEQLSAEPY